ncbi:hypothetical protein VF14_03370 [Nostoc linckia z18]|jgi:hypothetical protein|uniref:Uncharacterized protein n=2 Tax=Nostoc linckia TaxID=92942 RepID=A0A9Q5ZH99_NOSLI|nr:hypothetical protein [Nostoc linckia]PHK42415.1 hypothetical protein VF12_03385 [Nostoc linckia z15]PHK46923.1 hypothetical protein VF13_08010 [Nostoc linckia z16]PHJ69185.1 hypothetical protein VF02_00840 [Nostoc linckia z1]PHJ73336.1 hypothetical protein VF05_01855 [Nostoc linckia z3]PHJ78683.1 hypothetical protein VF03_00840 [Nostoc linckia z2]
MSINIWRIISRGVMPNGEKIENAEYIIVEDNFHDRKTNEYIPIASEPLYREDVEELISGERELTDFELTEESVQNYSDEDWEKAQQLEEQEWEKILKEL